MNLLIDEPHRKIIGRSSSRMTVVSFRSTSHTLYDLKVNLIIKATIGTFAIPKEQAPQLRTSNCVSIHNDRHHTRASDSDLSRILIIDA